MRRRKPLRNKVCAATGTTLNKLESNQSAYSRRHQILRELGEDFKEMEREMKLIMLNRMSKIGLI